MILLRDLIHEGNGKLKIDFYNDYYYYICVFKYKSKEFEILYDNIYLILIINYYFWLKMLRLRNYVQGYFTIDDIKHNYWDSIGKRIKYTGLTFTIIGFGLACKFIITQ